MKHVISSIVTAMLVFSLASVGCAAGSPDRPVSGHTVVSAHDPKAQIDLPASSTYVGSDRWILQQYFDDVDLHAFVAADAAKQVQHLYWVQFEAYLPSHPEEHHTYDSTRHVTLGGMDFLVDTWTESPGSKKDVPDSDDEHLHVLLTAKGYSLPASMISVRFVHLMDGARKEMMYIYSEDAAPTGFTASDLKKGGKAYSQWPAIEAGLIERGQASIKFH